MKTNNQKLEILFDQSPSLKMLRMRSAPLIISFLYQQFKVKGELSIRNDVLVQRLANFLDELDYVDEELREVDYFERAKKYIENWTNEAFLRNYIDESEKVIYNVLTQHTERVFQMIDLLKEREFVGTESKFKDIFYKLRELVDNNTEDPKKKIEELERQKKQVEQEIRRIKRDGKVQRFEDYQIKSRFSEISRLTNELMGDFREVEDVFRNITRVIYGKQEQKDLSKGQILHYTFDALDELKESDQGKSFYAFWSFLIDDASQEELRYLIDEVYRILEDRGIKEDNYFLRRIKSILYASGRKVLDGNNLLADKLSRVIAEKSIAEKRKMRNTIAEIRKLALQAAEDDSFVGCGIELEMNPVIRMPLERRLGEEKVVSELDAKPEQFESEVDLRSMAAMFNPNQVDRAELKRKINTLLSDRSQVTLSEVAEQYPITKGLGELIGYIALLNTSDRYLVNEEILETVLFDSQQKKYLTIPQIIFSK